ncbi:MAG: leucyl aminopeptidase [Anaerolineae bacterium]|jgi:leucyl aminopeptidase|nr:leucyl aminopeptidase [Anaerolineae bacterium]
MTIDVLVRAGTVLDSTADALVVFMGIEMAGDSPRIDSLDKALDGALSELVSGGDFKSKPESTCVLYPRGKVAAKRVILVGIGTVADFSGEVLRRAAAVGVQQARGLGAKTVEFMLPSVVTVEAASQVVVEGAMLGLYTYRGQKSTPDESNKVESLSLVVAKADKTAAEAGLKVGSSLARAAHLARELVNMPPNICTPAYLAQAAVRMAGEVGLRADVLERGQMVALRMGALLAVAQGSKNSPRFIILEHNAARAEELPTLVLVGKGVTFDTGGYSIKTADGMVGMKADMGGAAAVIGAMQAIAELDVPLHVVGLIPSVENMINDEAYRPQDVLTASNGKTIEVISTDAEGRLILADALVYSGRYKPTAVVDIATLTGSMAGALGNVYAGFYVTDPALRSALTQAGGTTHERLWEMPLAAEYRKLIDTDTADMKNTGGRLGGANIAAMFLKEFVECPAWAHIDMAGVMSDAAGNPTIPTKGGTGFGARLLAELARVWSSTVKQGA